MAGERNAGKRHGFKCNSRSIHTQATCDACCGLSEVAHCWRVLQAELPVLTAERKPATGAQAHRSYRQLTEVAIWW